MHNLLSQATTKQPAVAKAAVTVHRLRSPSAKAKTLIAAAAKKKVTRLSAKAQAVALAKTVSKSVVVRGRQDCCPRHLVTP